MKNLLTLFIAFVAIFIFSKMYSLFSYATSLVVHGFAMIIILGLIALVFPRD